VIITPAGITNTRDSEVFFCKCPGFVRRPAIGSSRKGQRSSATDTQANDPSARHRNLAAPQRSAAPAPRKTIPNVGRSRLEGNPPEGSPCIASLHTTGFSQREVGGDFDAVTGKPLTFALRFRGTGTRDVASSVSSPIIDKSQNKTRVEKGRRVQQSMKSDTATRHFQRLQEDFLHGQRFTDPGHMRRPITAVWWFGDCKAFRAGRTRPTMGRLTAVPALQAAPVPIRPLSKSLCGG